VRTGNIADVTIDACSFKTLYARLINTWATEMFGAETAVSAFFRISTAYMEKRH